MRCILVISLMALVPHLAAASDRADAPGGHLPAKWAWDAYHSHDELVAFIDGVDGGTGGGLALCYNEMNFEGMGEAESLRNFTTVSSLFYPDLEDHYEAVFDRWVEEKQEPCDDEGDGHEDEEEEE